MRQATDCFRTRETIGKNTHCGNVIFRVFCSIDDFFLWARLLARHCQSQLRDKLLFTTFSIILHYQWYCFVVSVSIWFQHVAIYPAYTWTSFIWFLYVPFNVFVAHPFAQMINDKMTNKLGGRKNEIKFLLRSFRYRWPQWMVFIRCTRKNNNHSILIIDPSQSASPIPHHCHHHHQPFKSYVYFSHHYFINTSNYIGGEHIFERR